MAMYVEVEGQSATCSSINFKSNVAVPEPDDVIRRSAKYHPSVWGHHFLSYTTSSLEVEAGMKELHQGLKEQVRAKLIAANTTRSQLDLIDKTQRLGISYNFEHEIELALHQIYQKHDDGESEDENGLHWIALRFRLLRQHGYNIPCDQTFKMLKDNEGKFKESLSSDVQGMLSLFEAAHMRVHGEDLLEEALEFTTNHLQSMIAHTSNPLVSHALNHPIRKSLQRPEARHYISIFQDDKLSVDDQLLLNFAKLDFNLLQKSHQREIADISRWWKDLDVVDKLPFIRDRVVECYFWIQGVYFEPQYHLARIILTKVIAVASILDDLYDNYGTLEELRLFTDAIERWDICAMDPLPEYMKLCYRAILDVYSTMEKDLASHLQKNTYYRVQYAKAAVRPLQPMKELVRAYFDEAKLYYEDNVPSMEEYMKVAMVTGAYKMLATTAFVGMEEEFVNEETFAWVSNGPLIVRASSVICRLMDDMAGHEFEQERGHTASAVECYMKQHGASKHQVHDIFKNQVTSAWKDLNQECIRDLANAAVSLPVLMRVINLARVITTLYTDGDGYTHSNTNTKRLVASLLVDSVP